MADNLAILRSRLRAEVTKLLIPEYGQVDFDQENCSWVHVHRFPLPRKRWSFPTVEILLDINNGNPGYPQFPPQWFWVDKDLRTVDGTPIHHFFVRDTTFNDQQHLHEGWGHYCVHLAEGYKWQPSNDVKEGDNLLTFFRIIELVFRNPKLA